MKTVWGLFIGEELINKSERRKDLFAEREELQRKYPKKNVYISVWLGRLDSGGKRVEDTTEED